MRAGSSQTRAWLDDALHQIGQVVGRVVVAADVQPHRREAVGAELANDRVLGLGRKLAENPLDRVRDVRGGLIDVASGEELQVDGADAEAAGRAYAPDAVDAVEDLLQRLGDRRLDRLRTGPVIQRHDRDHGLVDVRVLANREAEERRDPCDRNQQAHHRGQDRTLD
jgi:hypothetical protein